MAAIRIPWWAWLWPLLAWLVLAASLILGTSGCSRGGGRVVLIATVFAAVYHAEVVAHRDRRAVRHAGAGARGHGHRGGADRLGDAGGAGREAGLARDTVFAAVMIVVQRHRRAVPAGGRRASPRAGVPAPGRERRARGAGGAHHAHAGRCPTSPPPRPARASAPRSSSSRASSRSCSMGRSSSCRRCATATISFPRAATRKRTRRRPRTPPRSSAPACCWSRWSRSWGSPRP